MVIHRPTISEDIAKEVTTGRMQTVSCDEHIENNSHENISLGTQHVCIDEPASPGIAVKGLETMYRFCK